MISFGLSMTMAVAPCELTNTMRSGKCESLPQETQTIRSGGGSQPLISVCIPSYNNDEFIAYTLESVLKQTYANLEIIITDDKSTDKTVSVIKGFTDPRIKLIQNETNLGIGLNWNKGLGLATGKYVKVVCGDDVLYPDCLRRQVEALESPSHSQAVLAICNSDVINANGQIVLRRRCRFKPGLARGKDLIRDCVRWGANRIGEPVVGLFKREVLAKSGMFDPANPYMIDLAFWAEVLKQGDAFIDESRLAAFRISRSSVTAKVGFKQAMYFRRFIRKMHRDPAYRINSLAVLTGYVLSLQWCILRNVLTHFQAVRRSEKQVQRLL
jgi:glycosyltransferase involved in cell wall biosynthesis